MSQPEFRFPDLNEVDVLCLGINRKKARRDPKYGGSIWMEIQMDGERDGYVLAFKPADARSIVRALNKLADRVEGEKAQEAGQ